MKIVIDKKIVETCLKSEYPVILDLKTKGGVPFYGIVAAGNMAKVLKEKLETFLKEKETMDSCYRLYSSTGVFQRSVEAKGYEEAIQKFKKLLDLTSIPDYKVFVVEDDGHEVECGKAWINDVLDQLEKNNDD